MKIITVTIFEKKKNLIVTYSTIILYVEIFFICIFLYRGLLNFSIVNQVKTRRRIQRVGIIKYRREPAFLIIFGIVARYYLKIRVCDLSIKSKSTTKTYHKNPVHCGSVRFSLSLV